MSKRIGAFRTAGRLSLLLIAGLSAARVRGEELSDNLANVSSGTESASVDRRLASSFTTGTATAHQLASVTLLLAATSPGAAAIDLHSDGGLEPGTLVATLTSPASYPEAPAATTFTAGGLALEAGATYWLVLRVQSGAFEWAWTADNAGAGTGYSPAWDLSEDSGSAWHTQDVYPLQLKVTVDTGGGAVTFLRGDANRDGTVDISDPIGTLDYLFVGAATPALECKDAADANDDGAVDLSDAVFTLTFKFLGGAVIPEPGPNVCGPDPTEDALPACAGAPAACRG